jgi:hypothetical protein
MHGWSYNLVLILVPVTFWAATRRREQIVELIRRGRRQLLESAVRAWRARRAAPSPDFGPDSAVEAAPQVTSPTGGPGKGPEAGPGGGSEEGAGKIRQPMFETLDNGTRGVWINVPPRRPGGGDA